MAESHTAKETRPSECHWQWYILGRLISHWQWHQDLSLLLVLAFFLLGPMGNPEDFFLCFLKIYYVYNILPACMPTCQKRAPDFHYRWLWATKWLLGIEIRTSERAAGARLSSPLYWLFVKTCSLNGHLVQQRYRRELHGLYQKQCALPSLRTGWIW